MEKSWLKGGRHNLKVPSTYHRLASVNIPSCSSVAKITCRPPGFQHLHGGNVLVSWTRRLRIQGQLVLVGVSPVCNGWLLWLTFQATPHIYVAADNNKIYSPALLWNKHLPTCNFTRSYPPLTKQSQLVTDRQTKFVNKHFITVLSVRLV